MRSAPKAHKLKIFCANTGTYSNLGVFGKIAYTKTQHSPAIYSSMCVVYVCIYYRYGY